MAVCLNGMQNVTSVHIGCVLRSTGFTTIQPPVILFHRHCNSRHQSRLHDSIPYCRLGSLPYISHKVPVAKQDLLTLSSAGAIRNTLRPLLLSITQLYRLCLATARYFPEFSCDWTPPSLPSVSVSRNAA